MEEIRKWDYGFAIPVDIQAGDEEGNWTYRHLSDMKDMYYDQDAVRGKMQSDDPVIYKYQTPDVPERQGDLSFGLSVLYPGKVGNEYHMTKGHFHLDLMTAEVYYCLAGQGMIMLEDQQGDWRGISMKAGEAVYVPRGYAHRSINTGKDTLVTFYTYAADAGHDYKTIETKGFRHLVVEEDGSPVFLDNPAWKEL